MIHCWESLFCSWHSYIHCSHNLGIHFNQVFIFRISNWMKVGDNHEKYLRKHKNSHKLRNPNLLLLHSFPMTCFPLFPIWHLSLHSISSLRQRCRGQKIRNAMHFSVMVFATISDHPEMYRSHFLPRERLTSTFNKAMGFFSTDDV